MKKELPLIIGGCIFVICIFAFFSLSSNKQTQSFSEQTITYNLEGKDVKLLVADTDAEHEKGLMFLREIKGADGMIFLFEDTTQRSFWNKNTLMDLDLYWIDGDTVVGKSFLPSIEKSKEIVVVQSPKPANKVIEIPRK